MSQDAPNPFVITYLKELPDRPGVYGVSVNVIGWGLMPVRAMNQPPEVVTIPPDDQLLIDATTWKVLEHRRAPVDGASENLEPMQDYALAMVGIEAAKKANWFIAPKYRSDAPDSLAGLIAAYNSMIPDSTQPSYVPAFTAKEIAERYIASVKGLDATHEAAQVPTSGLKDFLKALLGREHQQLGINPGGGGLNLVRIEEVVRD